MDVLAWFWWLILKVVGFVWSLAWFLLGGWVSTLFQLVIIVGVIFSYKYGWQRAPLEMMQRGKAFGGFVWAWMRAKEYAPSAAGSRVEVRERVRTVNRKEVGDVNLSTLLSVVAIMGLGLVAVTG